MNPRKTPEDFLKEMDVFFSDPNTPLEERHQLWNTLAALRGPDDGDERLKDATTAQIRTRAFPRTAAQAKLRSTVPAIFSAWPVGSRDTKNRMLAINEDKRSLGREVSPHFHWHINAALAALDEMGL